MKVGVGSRNPVKIQATRNILQRIYDSLDVFSVDVDSEIPDQPFGMHQTIQGAINRAHNALLDDYDLGVGIESGMMETPDTLTGYIDLQWCAIYDGQKETLGVSSGFEYPPLVVEEVLKGREVGDVMDQLTGVDDLGEKMGAVSYLSHGMLDRTENTEQCILMAMIPRMNEDIYFSHKNSGWCRINKYK